MAILKMADLDLKGKRVLIRADLNVPLKDGVITDETRKYKRKIIKTDG